MVRMEERIGVSIFFCRKGDGMTIKGEMYQTNGFLLRSM